jgi:hypothetical protein
MLGTIVLNVQYIRPQYLVHCSSILCTLNILCCFCLLIYLLLPLYSAVLPKLLTMSNSATVDEVGCLYGHSCLGALVSLCYFETSVSSNVIC